MFSRQTHTSSKESSYLAHALERVCSDSHHAARAQETLEALALKEPLFADCLRTPQDVRYHAEGPTVQAHLHQMLSALYALVEGDLRLEDIEEFRRHKGYEDDIESLSYALKEHAGFFEAYVLLHDIGKWPTVSFEAPVGSRGEREGFSMDPRSHWDGPGVSERAQLRKTYLELFHAFTAEHPGLSEQEVQVQFYLTYQIRVRYPRHERMIHAPVYHNFFHRVLEGQRISTHHRDVLEDLIGNHIGFIRDFRKRELPRVLHWRSVASRRGYDADEFYYFMLGALLLDTVCASVRLGPHGVWYDPSTVLRAMEAAHSHDPARRALREQKRTQAESERRQRLFRAAGLDGKSLQQLLGMRPSKEFGALLTKIQRAVVGGGDYPELPTKVLAQLQKREDNYHKESLKH